MKEALPRRIIELCGLDVETTSPDPRRVTSGDRAAQQTECHINREPREALSAQSSRPTPPHLSELNGAQSCRKLHGFE